MSGDDRLLARIWLRRLSTLPIETGYPWIGHVCVVIAMAGATVARQWLDPWLPPGFPFVTYFPVVIAAAFLFGLWPSILAAVLGGFLSNYYFIPPFGQLSLANGADMAMALYAFIVIVDIVLVHLMQRAFAKLGRERERSRRLADHRETLFHELQHRVGNNLQMISALLSLHKRRLADPASRTALDEASRRLALIGRIQRQLYDPAGMQLGVRQFLEQIGRDLIDTSGHEGVTFAVTGEDGLAVDSDAAIPLALIVAESISNALEHGLAGRERGTIVVDVARAGGDLAISVTDNGNGLPPGFDLAATDSLGLRLAQSLADGQRGRFTLVPAIRGATARLVMPLSR